MSNETPLDSPFPPCDALIAAALAEDMGPGDITSQLLIPESARATMQFVARQDMIACGTFIPAEVYRHPALAAKNIYMETLIADGKNVKPGDILATASGPARAMLTGERVALNLMQRMSGVATLTHRYVGAVKGTKAVIIDTRKTMPGLRMLDKYAVRKGGGQNHRMGLWDMVLVKDNHIALAGGVKAAMEKARAGNKKIVIECDTLSQVEEALNAGPDRILLDNMDLETMRKAVQLSAGRVPLEASGNVSLETVSAIAHTGVDYISVGKLTHSAHAVDIGADITIG